MSMDRTLPAAHWEVKRRVQPREMLCSGIRVRQQREMNPQAKRGVLCVCFEAKPRKTAAEGTWAQVCERPGWRFPPDRVVSPS